MQTVIEINEGTDNCLHVSKCCIPDSNIYYSDLEQICLDSLRYEVMAWPKPGLVSPVDSGSHRDMHLGTFFSSFDALQGSFAALARAGALGLPFSELQNIGIEA